MKNKIALSIIILSAALFTGCGTIPNPAAVSISPTGQMVTNPNVPTVIYTVPPGFLNVSNQIAQYTPALQAVAALTPAAPLAPLLPDMTNMLLGGIGGLLGLFAAYKNKQSNAHAAAAASMAATIVGGNLQSSAIANAATNGSSAAVAVHLANAANPVQL